MHDVYYMHDVRFTHCHQLRESLTRHQGQATFVAEKAA